MQTFTIVSIVANIALIILVLWLVSIKYREGSKIKKIMQEKRAKQRRNVQKAQMIKTIRLEVRRYLKELQDS